MPDNYQHAAAPFEVLLARATESLNARAAADPLFLKGASSSEVEAAVSDALRESADGNPFHPEDIRLVSGARFPDIVIAGRFGVEVKSTIHDHWTSTGSSIVETTRDPGVDTIALMFAKLGGARAEFRCRPYADVLKEIAVTHCPRYLIDMDQAAGDSIFDRMGTDYDSFRTGGNAIATVRDYYRRKALAEGRHEMPWWLGDAQDDAATSVTVGFWKDLPPLTRADYQARMFALFPEVLKSDFDNASLWLVTTKSVLNAHIRDTFTAGGTVSEINGERLDKPVPQIYKRLIAAAPRARLLLDDPEFLSTEVAVFNPALLPDNPVRRDPHATPSLFDQPEQDKPAASPFDLWLAQIEKAAGDRRLKEWIIKAVELAQE